MSFDSLFNNSRMYAQRNASATTSAPQLPRQTRANYSSIQGGNDRLCDCLINFFGRCLVSCFGWNLRSTVPDTERDVTVPGEFINSGSSPVTSSHNAYYNNGQVEFVRNPVRAAIVVPPIPPPVPILPQTHIYTNPYPLNPPRQTPLRRMLPLIPTHGRRKNVNQMEVPPTNIQINKIIDLLEQIKEQEICRNDMRRRRRMQVLPLQSPQEFMYGIPWPETLAKLNRVVLDLEVDLPGTGMTRRLQVLQDEETESDDAAEHALYMRQARTERRKEKYRKNLLRLWESTYNVV